MSNFDQRKKAVAEFNAQKGPIRRGLALQIYGHPIGSKNSVTLHQGRATVHVASDGSVFRKKNAFVVVF
jgi:xanthine dehydrogenase molybdopterin-binding subunit B